MIDVQLSLGTESQGWAVVLLSVLAHAPARLSFCAQDGLAERSLEKLLLSSQTFMRPGVQEYASS